MSSPKEIAEKVIETQNRLDDIHSKLGIVSGYDEIVVIARAYLELEKEIQWRKEVYDKLDSININLNYEVIELKSEITKLKKSREVLMKACEFYASSDQWNCTKEQLTTYNTIDKDDLGIGDFQFACDVDDDRVGGKTAREALKADDELMGCGK